MGHMQAAVRIDRQALRPIQRVVGGLQRSCGSPVREVHLRLQLMDLVPRGITAFGGSCGHGSRFVDGALSAREVAGGQCLLWLRQ